jgi:hypothetical protein
VVGLETDCDKTWLILCRVQCKKSLTFFNSRCFAGFLKLRCYEIAIRCQSHLAPSVPLPFAALEPVPIGVITRWQERERERGRGGAGFNQGDFGSVKCRWGSLGREATCIEFFRFTDVVCAVTTPPPRRVASSVLLYPTLSLLSLGSERHKMTSSSLFKSLNPPHKGHTHTHTPTCIQVHTGSHTIQYTRQQLPPMRQGVDAPGTVVPGQWCTILYSPIPWSSS